MERNIIHLVLKACGYRQADSGKNKPVLETVNNPDPRSPDLKIRGLELKTLSKRADNSWTYEHITPATLGIASFCSCRCDLPA